jgi:hypothetical protein
MGVGAGKGFLEMTDSPLLVRQLIDGKSFEPVFYPN